MYEWKCEECTEAPCKIMSDCIGIAPTNCVVDGKKCPWERIDEQPAPQPEPKPKLMTMADAIFEAVSMGGGEIWQWQKGAKRCTVRDGKTIWIGEPVWDEKLYTVRPLPVPTLTWNEALEKVNSDAVVSCEYNGATHALSKHSLVSLFTGSGVSIYVPISELKDKRFTAVQP